MHTVSAVWEGSIFHASGNIRSLILMKFGNVGFKQKYILYFSLQIIEDYVLQHTDLKLKVISFVINVCICHSNELYFRSPCLL
jgi:uncharacterized protein YlbG (UPF0298 family)